MLTVPPPVKPAVRIQTNQKPLKMYTLHETFNNMLALRAKRDNDKTATIAFTRKEDVLRMGTILENHYLTYKEWPDMVIDESIKIFSLNAYPDIKWLHTAEWTAEELTMLCAGHYMDIMQIDELIEHESGFRIKGARLRLSGSHDYYIAVCNRMLRINFDGTVNPDFDS